MIRFKILKQKWIIRALDQKTYRRKNGKGSVAITRNHKRRIDLSPKGCDLETIVHELVHAYLYEMCAYSSCLDIDQLEEFYAELMSKRGYELLELSESLHESLKRSSKS